MAAFRRITDVPPPKAMSDDDVIAEIERVRASFAKPVPVAGGPTPKTVMAKAKPKPSTFTEQVRAHKQKLAQQPAPPPRATGKSLTSFEQRQRAAEAKRNEVTHALPSAQELSAAGFEMEMKPPIIRPARTLANARLAIRLIGFICSYDEFTGRYLIEVRKGIEVLGDQLVIMIRRQILDEYGFDPSKVHVRDALEGMCLDNRFNPVVDWLESLTWDRVPRLDTWLIRHCHADDTPLNRAIGRKVLCAMVRRAKHPGCKFDHVMVLEGLEGIFKSTLVRKLAEGPGPGYFSDASIIEATDKQQQELTKGVWAYEIGELKGIRKAEVEKVKQFISRQSDKARAAYAHYVVDQPRQCVFIGTTNDREYLMSQTGNRRWWPVDLFERGPIDLDGLCEERDQLFAEAVACEPEEDLFIGADLFADLRDLHETRRVKHVWEDELTALDDHSAVSRYEVEGGIELRIHTKQIFHDVLGKPTAWTARDDENKTLSAIMQRLGWTKSPSTIRVRGRKNPAMGYTKPLRLVAHS
jgi:hypothetical protein